MTARAPSAKTVTTAIRIASCPLVSRLRSIRPQPRPTPLTASTAATTVTAMKTARMTAFEAALFVENTSVTRRMGPNSPAAPAARRNVPKRVRSSPASLRIGIRVPMAVVAIADPVNTRESTTPETSSRAPSEYASASESSQPRTASRSGLPRMRSKSIS